MLLVLYVTEYFLCEFDGSARFAALRNCILGLSRWAGGQHRRTRLLVGIDTRGEGGRWSRRKESTMFLTALLVALFVPKSLPLLRRTAASSKAITSGHDSMICAQ